MKTAQIMRRDLNGFSIRQNHKTGMLNATDLNKAFNSSGKVKQLGSYFSNDSTEELIDELCRVGNVERSRIKKTQKGGNDPGTWVSPELFVDLAMWYSVEFKAIVLKWVVDGLLSARDNSGESYKSMTKAIALNYNPKNEPLTYARIAQQISCACKVGSDKDKWQNATQEQLELRDKIQNTMTVIAEFCTSPADCASRAINKVINDKLIKK